MNLKRSLEDQMEMENSEQLGQLLGRGSQDESEATELGDLIRHWREKKKSRESV